MRDVAYYRDLRIPAIPVGANKQQAAGEGREGAEQ
jgi:hypothetical protein